MATDDTFWSEAVQASSSSDVLRLRAWLRDSREHGNHTIRGNAALRLGELGDHDSAPVIAALLTDSVEFVRASAASALARIGNGETERLLLQALGDESPLVRSEAAEALGRTGTAAACAPLRRCLSDVDPEVRVMVVHALLRLGDPDAPRLVDETHARETRLRWGRRRLWRDLMRDLTGT